MKKEELAKYLNEIETMDLVDALYDGEIHIEEQIECKMDDGVHRKSETRMLIHHMQRNTH